MPTLPLSLKTASAKLRSTSIPRLALSREPSSPTCLASSVRPPTERVVATPLSHVLIRGPGLLRTIARVLVYHWNCSDETRQKRKACPTLRPNTSGPGSPPQRCSLHCEVYFAQSALCVMFFESFQGDMEEAHRLTLAGAERCPGELNFSYAADMRSHARGEP